MTGLGDWLFVSPQHFQPQSLHRLCQQANDPDLQLFRIQVYIKHLVECLLSFFDIDEPVEAFAMTITMSLPAILLRPLLPDHFPQQ